jgi:hypothetical protein
MLRSNDVHHFLNAENDMVCALHRTHMVLFVTLSGLSELVDSSDRNHKVLVFSGGVFLSSHDVSCRTTFYQGGGLWG